MMLDWSNKNTQKKGRLLEALELLGNGVEKVKAIYESLNFSDLGKEELDILSDYATRLNKYSFEIESGREHQLKNLLKKEKKWLCLRQ